MAVANGHSNRNFRNGPLIAYVILRGMSALQFIGVDVGGTSIRAARFAGHSHIPVAKTKVPTQAAKGADVVLQRLEAAIRQVAGHELDNVAGIGIAAAGPLNPHTAGVLNAPNL